MSSEPTRYVDSIKFSHTMSNANRRFVDGFRQIAHIGGFHCEIDSESLVAKPINRMSSVEEALSDLEPHLRAWELRSELLRNSPFRFKRSGDVVRDEGGGQVIGVGVIEEVNIANEVIHILTTSRLEIPKGPPLVVGEEIKRLSARWREVVQGEERLLVGSYWVLTEIQRYFGDRSKAGKRLDVSSKVLGQLGRLSARNDPDHGRKARSPVEPLSQQEVSWIQSLMPLLILRVAEVESGMKDLQQITMAGLPSLPDDHH